MHVRGIQKRTDGYDPGESRILLNIARALNFLPIKPPASLFPSVFVRPLSTPCLPVLPGSALPPSRPYPAVSSRHLLSLSASLSPPLPLLLCLNLIRSLPARFPESVVGYSVTVHERRLISIPAAPPPPTPAALASLTPRSTEKLPRICDVVGVRAANP